MYTFHLRERSTRQFGFRIFQIAALALAVTLAMPARAAEERAVKSKVPPVYPEIAKRMRIEGVVKVEAKVDAEGRVVEVKVINGSSMLSSAASDAIRKWRFIAGTGESTVNVALNFSLAQ